MFCLFSPPVLLAIAWVRFLERWTWSERPTWRAIIGAANLVAASALLGVCAVKLFGYHCDAAAGDWSCVASWRDFSGSVGRLAPVFLLLAILGAKRTRALTFTAVLAIALDVILIDMLA